jgi:hypothetical protein
MASKSASESAADKTLSVIKRVAVDTSGCIGSLYDVPRNRVLEKLKGNFKEPIVLEDKKSRCTIETINRDQSLNLLKLIGLDEDLRLSLLLGMTSKNGLASVIDYPYPINEYTRVLHYSYIDREEKISDDAKKAQQCVKSSMPQIDATHIITGLTWGVTCIVVLQLPDDAKIVAKIDSALANVRLVLEQSNNVSDITENDRHLLEKINKTKVYSNVPKLMELTPLFQICQYVIELGQKSGTYHPLEYTLQPIGSLYSNTQKSWPSYYSLGKSDSSKLERYLIEISTHLKKVRHWLDFNDGKILVEHPKKSFNRIKNECHNLEKAHEDLIEHLKKLIFDIRSGKKNTSEIEKTLKHKDQTTLIENIRKLVRQIKDTEVKGLENNCSQQQNVDYCDEIKRQVSQINNGGLININQRSHLDRSTITKRTDKIYLHVWLQHYQDRKKTSSTFFFLVKVESASRHLSILLSTI